LDQLLIAAINPYFINVVSAPIFCRHLSNLWVIIWLLSQSIWVCWVLGCRRQTWTVLSNYLLSLLSSKEFACKDFCCSICPYLGRTEYLHYFCYRTLFILKINFPLFWVTSAILIWKTDQNTNVRHFYPYCFYPRTFLWIFLAAYKYWSLESPNRQQFSKSETFAATRRCNAT